MAKEFDIYLNKRVTECDVLVYNLPYRDGLSVANRLILESCLQSYILQKMIAVQTGSKLVAHINDMIKLCNERLSVGMELSQDVSFSARYLNIPDDLILHLGVSDLTALESIFFEAENNMVLDISPVVVSVKRPFANMTMPVEIGATVNESKQSMIDAITQTQIEARDIDTWKHGFIDADTQAVVNAELANLCYSLYETMDNTIGIAQYVLGTEIHYPLGRGNNALLIGGTVTGISVERFIEIDHALHIMADAIGSAIKYITLEQSGIVIDMDASPIVKRHRLLSEMDGDTLSDYDDMTLDEIDFVIL